MKIFLSILFICKSSVKFKNIKSRDSFQIFGLLEGTVNKIKAVKRQMYNRAGIKLLRAKIIYSQ